MLLNLLDPSAQSFPSPILAQLPQEACACGFLVFQNRFTVSEGQGHLSGRQDEEEGCCCLQCSLVHHGQEQNSLWKPLKLGGLVGFPQELFALL